MNRLAFPWLALGIGSLLLVVLLGAGARDPAAAHTLPLLTLLILSEFGFFLTAIGAILGGNALLRQQAGPGLILATLGCAGLALGFLFVGISLWPSG